ncbi:MAG TPA: hypothetical protein VH438_16520 [Gemmatimonadales bacterium]|jgi:hypothetical protein
MSYLTNKLTRAALLAVTMAACASGGSQKSPSPNSGSDPRLEVVNRSSADMDIFFVRTGQRIRLGLAPNNQTTRFSLSPSLMIGAGTVRFEAVPTVGGNAISTDPTTIQPNATVTLDVPPP